jgi:hypothetical protein
MERSISDADDNRTALSVPSTARFADFGMAVTSDFHSKE